MTTKLDRLVELGELVRSRNVDQGVAAELARLQFDCMPHLLAIAQLKLLNEPGVKELGADGINELLDRAHEARHALLEPVE